MESSSSFTFKIKVIDETGIFQAIWNNLKDHLNLHFVPLSYKENNNTKSLTNLNIRLFINNPNIENVQFTMYVFKLNSYSDLKQNIKEGILRMLQSEKEIFPILLMDIDNSESSMKSTLKIFEKIKSELKVNLLNLLPLNTNNNKLLDLINDFFRVLKNRISFEISKKIFTHSSNIDNLKLIKLENKENTYCYISNRDNLIEYLQAADFNGEIIKICESEMNSEFKYLEFSSKDNKMINFNTNKNYSNFYESFSLIDFDDNIIRQKIDNKNLTNLDYQIYLFNKIIKSYKNMRDFKKMYSFVIKFLNNINKFKSFFINNYYYNFWCINFLCKVLPFYKTLKSNYLNSYESETNLKAQIDVMYLIKKQLKNFSKLLNFDIPNAKIFKILANNSNDIIYNNNDIYNKEINEFEISFETHLAKKIKNYCFNQHKNNLKTDSSSSFISEDENYQNFIRDVKNNLDEKSKLLVLSKEKFLEEYLNNINSLEKSYCDLKAYRLIFRLQLEKLPLLFALGKFTEMKNTLIDYLHIIKKSKNFITREKLISERENDRAFNCLTYSPWTNSNNINFNNSLNERISIQNVINNNIDANDNNINNEISKTTDLEKWPLLIEYICSLLILLLNSIDKTNENIRIIIDILNVYQTNILISNHFDLEDKNTIRNILTKYLDENVSINYQKNSNYSNNSISAFSQNGEKENNNLLKVNLNDLINLDYYIIDSNNENNYNEVRGEGKYKNIYFYNKNKTKNVFLGMNISNNSDLEMKITSITIEFYDEINSERIEYDYNPLNNYSIENTLNNNVNPNIFIIKGSDMTKFMIEIDINFFEKIKNKNLFSLVIKKIYLYLTWGVLGIYKFKNNDTIIILKNNDIEIYSMLSNFYEENKILKTKLTSYKRNILRLNENTNKNKKVISEEKIRNKVFLNVENLMLINLVGIEELDFREYHIDIDLRLIDNNYISNSKEDFSNCYDGDNNKSVINKNTNNNYNHNENTNQDEENINLEIIDEINFILFNDDVEMEQKQNMDISYLVSLTNERHKNLNEPKNEKKEYDFNSNKELNINNSINYFSKKNKNIRIFSKELHERVINAINPTYENNLYKFLYKRTSRNVNVSYINTNLINDSVKDDCKYTGNNNSIKMKKGLIILSLLFSNSEFNKSFKQKFEIIIKIKDNSNNSTIFQTKEEYDLDLIHLFNFTCKPTLKSIIEIHNRKNSINFQEPFINNNLIENSLSINKYENYNSKNQDTNNSGNNLYHIKNYKENILFILLQISLLLNIEYDNIFLTINKKKKEFNFYQCFDLVNKIPFNFIELISKNQDSIKDLDFFNNNINKKYLFKSLSFNFSFDREKNFINENEKIIFKNKNSSIDCFQNNDKISNYLSDFTSIKHKSNKNNKNFYYKSVEIKENIFFDQFNVSLDIKDLNYYYPLNYIKEKLEQISSIHYLIKLKISNNQNNDFNYNNSKDKINQINNYIDKIGNLKSSNFNPKNNNKSILYCNNQSRKSIKHEFLSTQIENSSFNHSIKYSNTDFAIKNSGLRDSKKSIKSSLDKINSFIYINQKNEKNKIEIYKEISFTLNIKNLRSDGLNYFMIKIKDDNNWTIVGKSRIIEKFTAEEKERNIVIKLIPLIDGYLKLPEFEFSNFLNENENEQYIVNHKNKLDVFRRKESANHMEFIEIGKKFVWMEGNSMIVKVYPLNYLTLKYNIV